MDGIRWVPGCFIQASMTHVHSDTLWHAEKRHSLGKLHKKSLFMSETH